MSERPRSHQPILLPEVHSAQPQAVIVDRLKSIHPHVGLWLVRTAQAGNLPDYIAGLQRAGLASDIHSAITYTDSTYTGIKNVELPIPRVDQSAQQAKHWGRLRRTLHGTEAANTEHVQKIYGVHGTTSHYAVRELMRGRLPRTTVQNRHRNLQIPIGVQMDSTDRWIQLPYSIPSPKELEPVDDLSGEVSEEHGISDRLLSYLQTHRDGALEALTNHDYWRAHQMVEPLYTGLVPIFGDYAKRLKAMPGETAKQLLLPTYLNWVNATLTFYDAANPRIIFPEIPVLERNSEAKSGRVDGLEILAIQNGALTPTQQEILQRMTDERFSSIGRVFSDVKKIFGDEVQARLVELKFDVGDDKKRTKLIRPEDIALGPVAADRQQVENYLTFTALAECGELDEWDGKSWPGSSRLTEGAELYYFIHSDPNPRQFHIYLTPEEQQAVFRQQHTSRLDNARERMVLTNITAVCVGNLAAVIEGGRPRQISYTQPSNEVFRAPGQKSFLPERKNDVGEIIRTMTDATRVFADRGQNIVELLGTRENGKPVLKMDYAALLDHINAGKIEVSHYFNPKSGGFVSCMMQGHEDSTPSMMIYPQKGEFHCYGCKSHGKLSTVNLPPDLAIAMNRAVVERKALQSNFKEIPQELYEMMTFAQEIFRYSFPGSPAEKYLYEERGISPETADELGVGYCDERLLIKAMLDEGYPMEMLKKYGLVTIGRESGRLYSLLNGRVTFPLADGEGLVNNFYGRAIREASAETTKKAKMYKHRKLRTDDLPHGVFNAQVLQDPNIDEVIVVEGCSDALSVYEMFHDNVVAIVGTGNQYGINLIAASGKDIALALDMDKEGGKASEKITEYLAGINYQGHVRDFTKEFVEMYPEANEYDDYNSYWLSLPHVRERGLRS